MPVRINHTVSHRGRAVLEVEDNTAAFFVLNKLQAVIEICAFGRPVFDELVKEMSGVYALLPPFVVRSQNYIRLHARPCP